MIHTEMIFPEDWELQAVEIHDVEYYQRKKEQENERNLLNLRALEELRNQERLEKYRLAYFLKYED